MVLKSFGCSFIFGTDLPDDGLNGLYTTGSRLSWPALLAKDLGYKYQTYAKPGSGNLQILERMLSQASYSGPDFFVIGWTYIERFDYLRNDYELWPGTPWKTILPYEQEESTRCYYKHFHSQLKDKLCTLIYIKTAIDTLIQKNIPFVMTYMDELIFETEWHTNETIIDLQNYIRPYMTTFNGKTFLEFTRINGYSISATAHPLELAHRSAADYLLPLLIDKKQTS
jgi:hypothetical protein